ncbi:hypothetical protein ACLK19_04985 [Escherichia coli]
MLELEHMGLPFSRLMMVVSINVLGGQSKNFGGEQAARIAAGLTVPVTHCCTRFISRT